MKSREHVTTNGRAVFFAAMWEDLRQAALSHGWALGLHGSLSSDMDIMAMPWDEHASTPEVMINQLCICFTEGAQIEKNIRISIDKPNNRTVYTLPIWADFYLDINVISPPLATDNTLPPPKPWELQIIRNIWRRAYLDSEEDHVKILKEYGEQARREAIQECIDTVFSMVGNTDFYPSQVARELSKLKG